MRCNEIVCCQLLEKRKDFGKHVRCKVLRTITLFLKVRAAKGDSVKKAVACAIIIFVVFFTSTAVWFTLIAVHNLSLQPQPNLQPIPVASPNSTALPLPTANLVATLNETHVQTGGDYLLINGTVTNESPNTAWAAGLKVYATSYFTPNVAGTAINMTVPVASAAYMQDSANTAEREQTKANGTQEVVSSDFPLVPLIPYEKVQVAVTIIPFGHLEDLNFASCNVTLVWANPQQ